MGRPLNKKYFGNRNVGSASTVTDDNIGGEGIASISFSNQGNFAGNGSVNPLVGLALPAPTLPGGVQATGTITYEVSTVTTGAGIAGLNIGDTYTFAGTGNAVFTVATLPPGGNATFTVTNRGTGVASVPTDTITVSMTKLTGSGANTFTVDIFFRVKSFVIVEQGSGYTGAETITVTLNTGATGTAPVCSDVLTVGVQPNASENPVGTNENAILMTAFLTSGSALPVDIIRQVSTNRYKVTDGTRTGIVKLASSLADAAGECSVQLTDSAGGTYFATKITSRKAVITRGTGTQFATGASVPWNMVAAEENVSLRIANA